MDKDSCIRFLVVTIGQLSVGSVAALSETSWLGKPPHHIKVGFIDGDDNCIFSDNKLFQVSLRNKFSCYKLKQLRLIFVDTEKRFTVPWNRHISCNFYSFTKTSFISCWIRDTVILINVENNIKTVKGNFCGIKMQ